MVLLSVSRGYSIVKGIFPRVTNPSAAPSRRKALDLHVLGLPPAFVLSQDQTLKLKASCNAILDVRTSAHHHLALLKPNGVFSVCCASVTKVTRSRQTVKLTLYHRTEILRALIYRRLIHRTEPNRPHISSDISISNSVRDKIKQDAP